MNDVPDPVDDEDEDLPESEIDSDDIPDEE